MTVATDAAQPPRVRYVEDGVTVLRAITFTFQDPSDLVVSRTLVDGTLIPLVLAVDYNVAGGGGLVGTLTMTSAGTAGDTLQIDRDTPHDQLSVYEPGDDFPADRVEGDFDKLTRIIQELARDILSRHDVQNIIAAMLHAGAGISIAVNAAGDSLTISSNLDIYAAVKAILAAGSGITLSDDDVLDRITISAAGLGTLPDCVELSGDQQHNGGLGGGGAGLTTEDVQDAVAALLVAGAGVSLVYDDVANTLTVINTSLAGYTDENARDAIGAALVAGSLVSIVVDDAGNTITINCTALDPSYRGLAVVTEAGAFDFVDSMGGKSILYTGGAAAATLQPDATHALSDGWGTLLRNKGTGPLTLTIGAGVSIEVNGATVVATSISLAIGAVAHINRWGVNDFTLNGPKVTWS